MNPYLATVITALGFVLAMAAIIIRAEYKRKKTMLGRIRRIYGAVPEREYEAGDLERISRYFERKKGDGFFVDDITWNDLDMDRVYMLINQTVSSPGEDVLYAMLRMPLFDREAIEKRERLIAFFAENPEKREKLQLLLSRMGKTWKGSLSETILSINQAPEVSVRKHIVMLLALLLSIFVGIPAAPLGGFVLTMLLMVVNTALYYGGKEYKYIDMYLEAFSSLLEMLAVADKLEGLGWEEIRPQAEAVREAKKVFSPLRKKAFFVTGKNNGDGNPLQAALDYVRMVFHVDILAYNSILKDVREHVGELMTMLDNMGELDAVISIASFRELLPLSCEPEFTEYDGSAELLAEDLYHLLLGEPVANSIETKKGLLVTGSNASGKSTFLKNIAVNSILAQTVCTCTCSVYRAPFFKVMTSMALRDDLSGGESYFIVEIKSLKRILDESRKPEPLLCIIDEVLRGTNTVERIAASSRILKALSKDHVLPFAATHDIELSYILDGIYENYHFEEEVRENEVVFDYLLRKGRAVTRNAIRLLDMLGYEKGLVEEAEKAAADFEETGVWKPLHIHDGSPL